MWVYDEKVDGESLINIINNKNENVKYLPNIKLPKNLVADSDIERVVTDADYLVFIAPHQFLPRVCKDIKPSLKSNVQGLTCVKGMFVNGADLKLPSRYLGDELGIEMSALSGANIAMDVAKEEMSEATIGTLNTEEIWKKFFSSLFFDTRSSRYR
eukprot:UN24201